jgi:lipopolysaccharide heptosyltransferase II
MVVQADPWREVRRILAIRLDAMGDVIMTGPALKALKESDPHRQLTLLTSSSGAQAARLMPFVDDVLCYEAPWMKAVSTRAIAEDDHRFIQDLRALRFDAAVIFTVFSQNPLPAALMCYLADIPLRLAHCRENPYRLLTDWVSEPEPETGVRHEVRRQLDLVRAIGAYTTDERLTLTVPSSLFDPVNRLLERITDGQPNRAVVIHAGATAASRRYPPEQFAEVAQRLAKEFTLHVIFTGTERERELVESIRLRVEAPTHSLVGQLNVPKLAALLAQVPLLISNNTGTVHIAAAVGTPVVDLYALTNPQHTPWHVPNRVLFHDVPCKFCYKSVCPAGHHDCLRLIKPDDIITAALGLLGTPSPPLSHKEGVDSVHAWS